MGRRRERRQAVSRRLKIDLSANEDEPPSPAHSAGMEDISKGEEEEHGDTRGAGQASPTQSNTVIQENPLSLLGQYSDDYEGEEGQIPENRTQESVKTDEEKTDVDAQVADFIAELETSGLLDKEAPEEPEEKPQTGHEEQTKESDAKKADVDRTGSLATMIGDVVQKVLAENEEKTEWKAVLHEETGEYYYWNVVTGATTWDKPESTVEVADSFSVPPLPSEAYVKVPEYEDGYATATAVSTSDVNISGIPAESYPQFMEAGVNTQEPVDTTGLIQLGENISERFKALCGEALSALPARVKLAIEAEIRLSDCRLLVSQGTTDGLLWSHLKRLESLLTSEEAAQNPTPEPRAASVEPATALVDDVDMEVDMDIDESTQPPLQNFTTELPPQQIFAPVPPLQQQFSPPPLPPDEDWVPPPPPGPDMAPAPLPHDSSPVDLVLYSNGDGGHDRSRETTPVETPVSTSGALPTKKTTKAKTKKRNTAVPVAPIKGNKKVSSLVNKWLAAKEELHEGEEDEEEKALYDPEAMERKRKREIEEWRREQIASGHALENANFQPLGVDWRERLKKRRKEAKQENKAPDLEQISRELPPGWKAYWDEASGDVYYGNVKTSETTWDRPR